VSNEYKEWMRDNFEDCIERTPYNDGSLQIKCKLGNFSVSGADRDQVEREARRYWEQYYLDGDYDGILEGGK